MLERGISLVLTLFLSAAAFAQPEQRARELMREHRYGRALQVLSSQKSDDASVLRFTLLFHLGQLQEAATLLQSIDVRSVSQRDSFDQVQFFLARGSLESYHSDTLAEKNYREAVRRADLPDDKIVAKLSLARLLLSQGDTPNEESKELFEQAGLLLPEARYPATFSYYLRQQAYLLEQSGLRETATPLYFAALDKSETAGLPLVAATCYRSLARDFSRRGDSEKAFAYQQKAIRISIAEGEWKQSIDRLASLSYMHGGSVESVEFYKDELLHALHSHPPLRYRLQIYTLLAGMGGSEAEKWARTGLKESADHPEERTMLLKALAAELEGRVPVAELLEIYRQAEALAEPKLYREYSAFDTSLGVIRYDMAELLLREHRYREARDMLDKAALALQGPGRRWYLTRALNLASAVSLELGDLAAARVCFQKVVEVVEATESENERWILAAGLIYIHTYSALLEGFDSDPSSIVLGISPLAEKLLQLELSDERTYRLLVDTFDQKLDGDRQAARNRSESAVLYYKGTLYEATGRREEARRAYQTSLQLDDGAGRHSDLFTYLALARLAYKDDGWAAARDELRKGLSTLQDTADGDYFYLALGSVELALENYSDAVDLFRKVESERSKSPALYGVARAQLGLQEYDRALESVAEALHERQGQSLSLQGRLYLVRGDAERLSGKLEESREDYLRAVEALETTRQWTSLLEAYMGLRDTLAKLGLDSEAEEIQVRARGLLESASDEIDPNRLRGALLSEVTQSAASFSPPEIGREVASDRQGFLLLQERLKREHPERIKFNSPYSPTEIFSLQEKLPDDSAIIFIQAFSRETYISAFTSTQLVTREIGVGRTEILSQGQELTESFIRGGEGSHRPQRLLYELFLQPLEGALESKARWRFLPTPEIESLPLGALIDSQGATLSQERIVSFLPHNPASASPELKATNDSSILLLGAPTGQDLAGVRRELLQLGAQFPESSLLIGEEATTDSFLQEFEKHHVVHIASHASPKGIELSDKYLSLKEIYEATLSPGTLVVLSACRTARSEGHASSLAEAFQVAGASSVIASLWKVDDQATAELFSRFYTHLRAGRPTDEALTLAQREMQDNERWKNAYFWGGFVLYDGLSI